MGVLGIKGTGGCSFSTESLFAFFAKGFLVDNTFNLRFCTNYFSSFGVCCGWPFLLLETSFGAFVVPFSDVDLPFSGSGVMMLMMTMKITMSTTTMMTYLCHFQLVQLCDFGHSVFGVSI